MTSDTTLFLDLLERRIALLGSLAAALTAARSDLVAFDLDGLDRRIADQEQLCGEIRSIDANIDRVQQHCATQLLSATQPGAQRMQDTVQRLREAQSSVQKLNDAHQHLLRRSRLTVGALLNSYRTFALTYADPASTRVSLGERA